MYRSDGEVRRYIGAAFEDIDESGLRKGSRGYNAICMRSESRMVARRSSGHGLESGVRHELTFMSMR